MKGQQELSLRSKPFAFTQSNKNLTYHHHQQFKDIINTKKICQTMIKQQLGILQQLENVEQPIIQPFQQPQQPSQHNYDPYIRKINHHRLKVHLKHFRNHTKNNKKNKASQYHNYIRVIRSIFISWRSTVEEENIHKQPMKKIKLLHKKAMLLKMLKSTKIKDISNRYKVYLQMKTYRQKKNAILKLKNFKQHQHQHKAHISSTQLLTKRYNFLSWHKKMKKSKIQRSRISLLQNIRKHRNIMSYIDVCKRSITKKMVIINTQTINQHYTLNPSVLNTSHTDQHIFQQKRILLHQHLANRHASQLMASLTTTHKQIKVQFIKIRSKIISFYKAIRRNSQINGKVSMILYTKQQTIMDRLKEHQEWKLKMKKIMKKQHRYSSLTHQQQRCLFYQQLKDHHVNYKEYKIKHDVIVQFHHHHLIQLSFNVLKSQPYSNQQLEHSVQKQPQQQNIKQIQSIHHILCNSFITFWKASHDVKVHFQQLRQKQLKKHLAQFIHKEKTQFDCCYEKINKFRKSTLFQRLRMNSQFYKKSQQMIKINIKTCIKLLKQNRINQQHKRQLAQTIRQTKMKKLMDQLVDKREIDSQIDERYNQLIVHINNNIKQQLLYALTQQSLFIRQSTSLNTHLTLKLQRLFMNKLRINHQNHQHTQQLIHKQTLVAQKYAHHRRMAFIQCLTQYHPSITEELERSDDPLFSDNGKPQEQAEVYIEQPDKYIEQSDECIEQPDRHIEQPDRYIEQADEYIQQADEYIESYEQYKSKLMIEDEDQSSGQQSIQQLSRINRVRQKSTLHSLRNNYLRKNTINSHTSTLQSIIAQRNKQQFILMLKSIKLNALIRNNRCQSVMNKLQSNAKILKDRESMRDIVSYYQNKLNQKLLRKAFHILKPLQNNKEERYQQMKKCFEGLRMYTKQKQLLKKYLTEYDKIGYYPETVEDREQFNRIRNGR